MAFFDKLGEITKNVGDKTNDMIEINKLNSKIKTERTAIETVKAELGALYWAKFEAGTQLDDDAAELCAKIKGSFEAIAGFEAEIKRIKEENEKNIACAERELQQLATENADVDYVMNIVGEEKYVAKAKELIDSAQAEISLSIWRELFEVLRSNIENAISRGVKVYIFTFESILVEGATVYSYNINDVSTLFPYRRTTIIIDGGECLVGEEGDRNVYVHTRNHSVVSLATDEIVLNVFWNKLIEKENLLSKGCSGADFLQAIHNLAERYGITDEMTKNFLVYNFQKEKTQNGKKC